MQTIKSRTNWGLFWSGIVVAVLGIIMLFNPFETIGVASIIFGILLCGVGIVDLLAYAAVSPTYGRNGWAVAMGIVEILLGVLFLFEPLIAASVIPIVGGIYLICYGIFTLVATSQMMGLPGSGWNVFSGITAIIAGIVFFFAPILFVLFLSIYLICRGIAMIGNGIAGNDITGSNTTTYGPTGA